MKVIVGKTAGFCFGVKNAVNIANKYCNKYDQVYCLGELIHNRNVLNLLKDKGLVII